MQITEEVRAQYERAKLKQRLDNLDLDQATKDKVLKAKEKSK
jgi:hypothetical protein